MPKQTLQLWASSASEPGRLTGTIDGQLRFERLIGTGGIGEVYETTDLASGKRVAVKTLLPGVRNVREAVRRIEREARAGGMLDHRNIVDVEALGHLGDGTPYVVMELIDGSDLGVVLQQGPLPPGRALSIARQTLDGLAHAHQLGVLHRDLKPENLMLVASPTGDLVKILDLGLAKLIGLAASELGFDRLTETGAVFGTPVYMAPEQALGRLVTAATDLYAVGVILFEMLTGEPPFVGGDMQGTLRLHVAGPIPKLADVVNAPWCTRELERVIKHSLQKQPEDRFTSASEMHAAVWAAERSLFLV